MSRARPFEHEGEIYWFDQKARATAEQLELLADYEGVDLDDLLDEGLMQKQVIYRLRQAQSPGLIPEHVIAQRRERELTHGALPACRICSLNGWQCEGRTTRHHFVPRWLMLELDNYNAYSARSICTIPICVGRHRDLHLRDDAPKSIVPYLRDHERKFAQRMLDDLRDQRPKIFDLMAGGDQKSYEYQLIRDYQQGLFASAENAYELEEFQPVAAAAASARA
jgi:hypothetical protein